MEFKQYFGQPRSKTGTIMITELLDDATERELQNLFEEFGSIQRVKVLRTRNRDTGEWVGNGVAYITFWDKDDALDALDALEFNGLLYNYSRIKVKFSQ